MIRRDTLSIEIYRDCIQIYEKVLEKECVVIRSTILMRDTNKVITDNSLSWMFDGLEITSVLTFGMELSG